MERENGNENGIICKDRGKVSINVNGRQAKGIGLNRRDR